MTKECTLKEVFIISKLDEIQPDWRTGADVTHETKEKIRQRVFEKYSDLLEDAECISFRSIKETITRIRDKLNLPAKRDFLESQLPKEDAYTSSLDSSFSKPEAPSEIHETAEPSKPEPYVVKLERENSDPKTADPDVIFWCPDCNASFRLKNSDRESCPACHSTNIKYNAYMMNCGGGTCWRPNPAEEKSEVKPEPGQRPEEYEKSLEEKPGHAVSADSVGKEPKEDNCLHIPYGVYYFSQEGCSACESEKEVKRVFAQMRRISGEDIPNVQYINISKEKNPLPVFIIGTPTFIAVNSRLLYIDYGYFQWLKAIVGKEKWSAVLETAAKEDTETHMNEIKSLIAEGKKYRELCNMGYHKNDVKKCIDEVKKEKLNKCKDGVCPLPA